jgi:signal transduction histidine kinase
VSSNGRETYVRGMESLVEVVQDLSLARSLEAVMAIVRSAARRLTGADGATFVLREQEYCVYADEDAISPLWKGSRFPMTSCISGWAMMNRRSAVIEDVYDDDRIPQAVYKATFVKSMAMVPIRAADPIGAIGNYWAVHHRPTDTEVRLLQALADSTAVAMENVRVYDELEEMVEERTAELRTANARLDRSLQSMRDFVAIAAHDLRAPVASVNMAAKTLQTQVDDSKRTQLVDIMERQSAHLVRLTDDLLTLSVIEAGEVEVRTEVIEVDPVLRAVAAEVADRATVPVQTPAGLCARVDVSHLQRMIRNLLGNALKYGAEPIRIVAVPVDGMVDINVLDSGRGVPPDAVAQIFERFSRGTNTDGKQGSGLGLSIVRELARLNGGDVVYADLGPTGICFRISLPAG